MCSGHRKKIPTQGCVIVIRVLVLLVEEDGSRGVDSHSSCKKVKFEEGSENSSWFDPGS